MKILVVDDSVVFRSAITQALSDVPGFDIHKSVSNGKLAVEELQKNQDIDLITLDMEMPILDGMETVREIRKFNKEVKIIIFASQTAYGAERTIKVLGLGANDFVAKVEGKGTIDDSVKMIRDNLVPKIKALVEKISFKRGRDFHNLSAGNARVPLTQEDHNTCIDVNVIIDQIGRKPDLVVLAASTGGPVALEGFFKEIKEEINIPMLLVQHMPPIFTTKLADSLTTKSPVRVVEAKSGDILKNGVCYLAPGDFHMTLNSDLSVSLNQDEKVCYVRPSADVLFDSVYKSFAGKILCIVLTGMGSDGMNGSINLKKSGADVIVQNEETSVVWGMPGSIVQAGVNPYVLPLEDLAKVLVGIAKK